MHETILNWIYEIVEGLDVGTRKVHSFIYHREVVRNSPRHYEILSCIFLISHRRFHFIIYEEANDKNAALLRL